MCFKTIKKKLTVKNVKHFLQCDRTNLIIFFTIIAVHLFLSMGLAIFGLSYSIFITMLYAIFNFPILLTTLSLSGYSIYSMNTSAVIIPLIVNVIYWYIIACLLRVPLEAKKEVLRYKYSYYIVGMFLFFAVLACIWFSLTIGSYYPVY